MSVAKASVDELPDGIRKRLLSLPSVRTRLEFQFALLTAAGGLVLASGHVLGSGQATDTIALIAVFSALFGFLFVDWLRVFELPPVGAYLAMAGAAAYCVLEFWDLQKRGEPQMISVALLLVMVQGVLMLQTKSRRILEQLAVFCLLELVVAAIFSDAIHFGLLLIPIAIVGASALSLLGLVTLMENIDVTLDRDEERIPKTKLGRFVRMLLGQSVDSETDHYLVRSASPASVISIYEAAGPWSRYAVLALAPSVFVIAAAFFYVLPRRIDASRSLSGGPALVGFDDEIRMEQLGQVMQNPNTAVKVKLTNARTLQPYELEDSLYLRGQVLEEYSVDYSSKRPVGKWISSLTASQNRLSNLPREYRPSDPLNRIKYDSVDVEVTCESMSRPSLFAIAPYHRPDEAGQVVHSLRRWTITRDYPEPPFPRIQYRFGTHAFLGGIQNRWIAQPALPSLNKAEFDLSFRSLMQGRTRSRIGSYRSALLSYDRSSVPTASRLAQRLLDELPLESRTTSSVATHFEEFLKTDPQFSYTLNLDATPIPNVDPVEQFLSVDRRGHCQYFASSLALMLRSVGIPCRVVVGYRTEEYNPIGKYYIARQLHAHSWVEALLDRDQIPADAHLAGQFTAPYYWMRLDPTPAASETDDGNREGVDGLISMANNIWEDYVVDMDPERQGKDLVEATGLGQVQDSYQGVFGAMKQKLSDVRDGRVGAGDLSLREGVPWKLILTFTLLFGLILLFKQIPIGTLFFQRGRKQSDRQIQQPSVDYYAQTLRELERIGIRRGFDETPLELLRRIDFETPALGVLTQAFIRQRYGKESVAGEDVLKNALTELRSAVDQRIAE